jgi:hypothetical protein
MPDAVPDAPDVDAARRATAEDIPAAEPPGRAVPAALSEEPPTGGLTAILGQLRDAAAAHDDEDPDAANGPALG